MRLIHLSDLHFWRYDLRPLGLLNKRLLGMAALAAGRARRFQLGRWQEVLDRVVGLRPDHVLITGDLTTTALEGEFEDARAALAPLLVDPERATIVPGNHDRYTGESARRRRFERHFRPWMGGDEFPWLKWIDDETPILGLDPTRAHLSATGRLPAEQLRRAKALLPPRRSGYRRLIVACHYPLDAPAELAGELRRKRLVNAGEVAEWLRTLGPPILCCGHVHAAWARESSLVPGQVSINAGAPLIRPRPGVAAPGFVQIELEPDWLSVIHHGWCREGWTERMLFERHL